jgi:hypothetical protein
VKAGIYSYSSEHPVSDFHYASEDRMMVVVVVVMVITDRGILQFYIRYNPLWGIHLCT